MALAIAVSKVSVTRPMEGMYVVTLNLKCEDGAIEVINKDFQERKRPAVTWTTVGNRLVEQMQKEIDTYKSTAAIFNSQQLDDAVTAIQNALTG